MENIRDLRDEYGQQVIPIVRIRNNISLEPQRVRLQYYADYLLDEKFTDARKAAKKIVSALRKIVKQQKYLSSVQQ